MRKENHTPRPYPHTLCLNQILMGTCSAEHECGKDPRWWQSEMAVKHGQTSVYGSRVGVSCIGQNGNKKM